MTVHSMCVGGVTDTTARLNIKTTGAADIWAHISTTPTFDTWATTPTASANGYGAATIEVTDLAPDTRYWWRGVDTGVVDTAVIGTFITDPGPAGEPASFRLGLWGDAGLTPTFPGVGTQVPHRSSFHPLFGLLLERALAENWRRIVSMGDEIYYNLGEGSFGLSATASLAQYRDQWNDVFRQPIRHELYRSCPWVYLWDDHDFGPNDSDSTDPGRDNACAAYRERCPSYDLPAGNTSGVWHSFDIGRVLFLASDTRADRVPGSTMLGSAQLNYIETVLTNSDAAALVWLMPTPWNDTRADTWGGFTAERNTLTELLGDTGWLGRLRMETADIHAASIDSGASNPYGGFPISLVASADATPSTLRTNAWYDTAWEPGRGQYATLQVDDRGGDIALTSTIWRGRRAMAWHTMTVPA